MKELYMAPELRIIGLRLDDVILASKEGAIGETIGSGSGGEGQPSFDDLP